jgi:hypothetical protein
LRSRTSIGRLATGDATASLAMKPKTIALTARAEVRDREAIGFDERKSLRPRLARACAAARDFAGAIVFIIAPENHRMLSIDRPARLFQPRRKVRFAAS